MVSRDVDNLATQRAALLLEHLAECVPGAKARILALVEDAGIMRPVTEQGHLSRHRMHPVKVVQNLCEPTT